MRNDDIGFWLKCKTSITILQLEIPTGVEYMPRSATASIHVGRDCYFDNQTILQQMRRLFQLLEFKDEFKGHTVELIVDNARYLSNSELPDAKPFLHANKLFKLD